MSNIKSTRRVSTQLVKLQVNSSKFESTCQNSGRLVKIQVDSSTCRGSVEPSNLSFKILLHEIMYSKIQLHKNIFSFTAKEIVQFLKKKTAFNMQEIVSMSVPEGR